MAERPDDGEKLEAMNGELKDAARPEESFLHKWASLLIRSQPRIAFCSRSQLRKTVSLGVRVLHYDSVGKIYHRWSSSFYDRGGKIS